MLIKTFIIIQIISGIVYMLYSSKAENTYLRDKNSYKKYILISNIGRVIMYAMIPIYIFMM